MFGAFGCLSGFEFSFLLQVAVDGEAQQQERESGGRHGDGVDGDGEGIDFLFEEIGCEEREQREAEEKAEIGVEDQAIGSVDAIEEMLVVDPIDARKGEGEQVDEQNGDDGAEAGDAVFVRDFQFEHHDGNDDGDDSVGEGFEAGGRGWLLGHLGCMIADGEEDIAGQSQGSIEIQNLGELDVGVVRFVFDAGEWA